MGFLDWIGRTRDGISGRKPRTTWISDVYADQATRAWAWVQETGSGHFDAGLTVRDEYFGVWKLKAGEGFRKEADAIREAQERFREWRTLEPEMKIASTRVHNVVNYWHVMAETPEGRELANKIAGGQLHDPVESASAPTTPLMGERAHEPTGRSPDRTRGDRRKAAEKYAAKLGAENRNVGRGQKR